MDAAIAPESRISVKAWLEYLYWMDVGPGDDKRPLGWWLDECRREQVPALDAALWKHGLGVVADPLRLYGRKRDLGLFLAIQGLSATYRSEQVVDLIHRKHGHQPYGSANHGLPAFSGARGGLHRFGRGRGSKWLCSLVPAETIIGGPKSHQL